MNPLVSKVAVELVTPVLSTVNPSARERKDEEGKERVKKQPRRAPWIILAVSQRVSGSGVVVGAPHVSNAFPHPLAQNHVKVIGLIGTCSRGCADSV